MSRPFITSDGIDIASGLLQGDRFIDRIEYKGEELATGADTTALQVNIDSNTQLIYDTSADLQTQIDTIASDLTGALDFTEILGSTVYHVKNPNQHNTYAQRYVIDDEVDHVIADSAQTGDVVFLDVPASRKKPVRITSAATGENGPIFVFAENNFFDDVIGYPGTLVDPGASGRDFAVFGNVQESYVFENVISEYTPGEYRVRVQGHFAGSVIEEKNTSINNLPQYALISGIPQNEGNPYLLSEREYYGLVRNDRMFRYEFGSGGGSSTISGSYNLRNLPGAPYHIFVYNRYNVASTIFLPASKSVEDRYLIHGDNSVTLNGNGSNLSTGGTTLSMGSNTSYICTWTGSQWLVEQYPTTTWALSGLGGGYVFGDLEVRGGSFNPWKARADSTYGDRNVTIGKDAGSYNYNATSVYGSVIIGHNALSSTSSAGSMNIAIGDSAMALASTAGSNVVVGTRAASANIFTGNSNVIVGQTAGRYITSGGSNTLLGAGAGYNKQIGNNNVAVGASALYGFIGTTTTYQSDYNIAVGNSALYRIRSGDYNIALGYQSIYANGTFQDSSYAVGIGYRAGYLGLGTDSIAIGRLAMQSNGTGSAGGVCIGYNARHNTNGHDYGVAVGYNATCGTYGIGVGRDAGSSGQYGIAIGYNSTASQIDAIAIGRNSVADGAYQVLVGAATNGHGLYGVAVGYQANAGGQSAVALGDRSFAAQQESIAIGYQTNTPGLYSIGIGSNSASSFTGGVAIGRYASCSGDYAIAIGGGDLANTSANATNTHSVAIGYNSLSTGAKSVALSPDATSTAIDSIAIGTAAAAAANYAISIGSLSKAAVVDGIAIGRNSESVTEGSIAIGQGATASDLVEADLYCIAIGYQATATSIDSALGNAASIAIGPNANVTGRASIGIGDGIQVAGSYSNAIGYGASASGGQSTAIGSRGSFSNGPLASGNRSLALGSGHATGSQSIAIGAAGSSSLWPLASGTDSMAIGYDATAGGTDAIALGRAASVPLGTNGAVAIGRDATASANQTVSIGQDSVSSGSVSVALGFGAQSQGTNSVALGATAYAHTNNSIAIGNGATAIAQESSIAIGQDAVANHISAIAIGSSYGGSPVKALSLRTVAIGYDSTAFLNEAIVIGTEAFSSFYSVAIGTDTTALSYGVAIGGGINQGGARATGSACVAIGRATKAESNESVAIGYSSEALANYTVAIGYNTTASHANSVVFGYLADSQWIDTFHIGEPANTMDLYVSGDIVGDNTFTGNVDIQGTLDTTGAAIFGASIVAEQGINVPLGDSTATVLESNKTFILVGDSTATLPASPTGGDIVTIVDRDNNFDTNPATIPGVLLEGVAATDVVLNVAGSTTMFIYVDGTFGWKRVSF